MCIKIDSILLFEHTESRGWSKCVCVCVCVCVRARSFWRCEERSKELKLTTETEDGPEMSACMGKKVKKIIKARAAVQQLSDADNLTSKFLREPTPAET